MRGRCFVEVLLVAATLAVFWPVCGNDFVVLDDNVNVYDNPYLSPVTVRSVLRFWRGPYEHLYIPFTYSVWAVTAALSPALPAEGPGAELNPRLFHTINLILHIVSVLVVFAILRMVVGHRRSAFRKEAETPEKAGGDWAAACGALIFAVHPIQVQAVAWVTGMKDLLSGLLSLVAVWQYVVYACKAERPEPKATRGARLHYTLASVAFALAMLSKPAAVAVPLVAWLVDRLILGRPAKKSAAALLGWVAIAAPIVVLTKLSQPDAHIRFIPPLWARFLVAADAVAFYIFKLFLPIRLGLDYGRTPEYVLRSGWIYFAWIVPFGLIVAVMFLRERRRWLAALGVFIAGILPVSGLVPAVFQNLSTVKDHYCYFSMLGPALAAAFFLSRKGGTLARGVCLLLLGILGALSVFQERTWRNDFTLFAHALKINPRSSVAHNNMGVALNLRGKRDEAVSYYTEALRNDPHNARANFNLGNAMARQGKYDEAIARYAEALRAAPNFPEALDNLGHALFNIGNTLAGQGKFDEAIARYRQALRLKPDYADACNNLGLALARQGRYNEAIARYRQALRLKPDYADACNNLGLALAGQSRYDEAIARYRQALRLKPDYAEVHSNLGNALVGQGKLDEAVAHYAEALRINPDYLIAHFNMGVALESQGKSSDAIPHFYEALRIRPDFLPARGRLVEALRNAGRDDEASGISASPDGTPYVH